MDSFLIINEICPPGSWWNANPDSVSSSSFTSASIPYYCHRQSVNSQEEHHCMLTQFRRRFLEKFSGTFPVFTGAVVCHHRLHQRNASQLLRRIIFLLITWINLSDLIKLVYWLVDLRHGRRAGWTVLPMADFSITKTNIVYAKCSLCTSSSWK